MKKTLFAFMALLVGTVYTSCNKNPVKPQEEHNHDEQSSVILNFYEGHYHGTDLHRTDTVQVAIRQDGKFIDPKTKAVLTTTPTVHMAKGEGIVNRLSIEFFDSKGDKINGEFLKEANTHQMFFLPGEAGVLDYEYKDQRIGFEGDFTVLQADKTIKLEMILRHGINKSTDRVWNDVQYRNYGGSTDFATSLNIHTEEGDAHH